MKIVLTHEESEKFFYEALCNGSVLASCGVQCSVSGDDNYRKAKERLMEKRDGRAVSFEDVWMEALRGGAKLQINDDNNPGKPLFITLGHVHERVQHSPYQSLIEMEAGEDDADTASNILQTVFFGEVIYG